MLIYTILSVFIYYIVYIRILLGIYTIHSREWRFCIFTVLGLIGSYSLICLPLIIVYNIEKTISASIIFNSNNNSDCKTSTSDMTLKQYLNVCEANYEKFKSYLVDCFAVEALLFYTDIILFRQVLIELLDKFYPNTCDASLFDKPYASVKFDYLIDSKESLENTINIDIINDDTIKNIKHMANELKTKYIDESSEYQINVSYRCRLKLLQFYDEINSINVDNNDYSMFIVKYVCAYGGALRETLRLLNSVYNFNFKKETN